MLTLPDSQALVPADPQRQHVKPVDPGIIPLGTLSVSGRSWSVATTLAGLRPTRPPVYRKMELPLCFLVATPTALTAGLSAIAGVPVSRLAPSRPRHASQAPQRRRQTVTAIFPWLKKGGTEEDEARPQFGFDVGFAFLAHPRKETGEDAFFVEATSIGVFDGVSTVQDAMNVDPRLYSQTLARLTSSKVKELGPTKVVRAAIEASQENDQQGASTACVVGMDGTGRLFGVNLGDSGVVIVRDGKQLFATKPQQHFHNCPWQLTSMSNAGYNSGDSMTMGQNVQQKLREGDVVVVATDGLYDNMAMSEIIARTAALENVAEIADNLADAAQENQMNRSYRSPFQISAEKAGQEWEGGKEDDLTIVVAKVVSQGSDYSSTTLLSTLPEA